MAEERQSTDSGDRAVCVGDIAGRLRENRRLVIVSVCLFVLLVLLDRVLAGEVMELDRSAIAFMVGQVRAAWLTPIMEAVSFMVTPVPLFVLIFATALAGRFRGIGGLCWFCTVNLVGSTILNQLLKFAIQRPRPDVSLRLVEIGGYSFPSGHSMAAMAFFGLFIWLSWHCVHDRRMRDGLIALLCTAIVAVGFSRVYLGVHYASDVLGGFCASLIWLTVYTKVAGSMLAVAKHAG